MFVHVCVCVCACLCVCLCLYLCVCACVCVCLCVHVCVCVCVRVFVCVTVCVFVCVRVFVWCYLAVDYNVCVECLVALVGYCYSNKCKIFIYNSLSTSVYTYSLYRCTHVQCTHSLSVYYSEDAVLFALLCFSFALWRRPQMPWPLTESCCRFVIVFLFC